MAETKPVPALDKAVAKVREGTISLDDLTDLLAPEPEAVETPEDLPTPATITDDERKALARVTDVFGSVVPAKRRKLKPSEVTALIDERDTLDTVEKMCSARKDDIRTTILNHNDVLVEEEGLAEDLQRDKDGVHYIHKQSYNGDGSTKRRFSVETRSGSANMNPSVLKALADDPEVEDFTHEDYLAMTEQTRVFDEHKAMLHLKKNPDLVKHIQRAVTKGHPSVSVYVRNDK